MLFARMLRAARFDRSLYAELRQDPVASAQALAAMTLTILALVIGALVFAIITGFKPAALTLNVLMVLALWLFPAFSLFLLGGVVRAKDPNVGTDRDLMIIIGFSASPGLLWLVPHPLFPFVVWGWVIASMVTATQAMLRVNLVQAVLFVLPGLAAFLLLCLLLLARLAPYAA